MTNPWFEIASGSVIGRDHRLVPKNCQDGLAVLESKDYMIGIVTDGCGSAPHSEVGAKLGARLLCESIRTEVEQRQSGKINWQRVQQHLLASLDVLVRQMGGRYRQIVEEYFLFTVVGVLITQDSATFFAIGDGVVVVNGEVYPLGPFPGNKPPYISYGLLQGSVEVEPEELKLNIVAQLALEDLEDFLIGCDGIDELHWSSTINLPGTSTPVGGLEQFWEQDRYFRNTELVSRQLKLIGRDWPKRDPEPGLLPDDTTLIVGRRRKEADESY